ncbi:hypothetical protein HDU82_009019 [Entophlyctis luteolus]|nr:hypothetical protein HDU82_009019 [Entophlyctis luteolus]
MKIQTPFASRYPVAPRGVMRAIALRAVKRWTGVLPAKRCISSPRRKLLGARPPAASSPAALLYRRFAYFRSHTTPSSASTTKFRTQSHTKHLELPDKSKDGSDRYSEDEESVDISEAVQYFREVYLGANTNGKDSDSDEESEEDDYDSGSVGNDNIRDAIAIYRQRYLGKAQANRR